MPIIKSHVKQEFVLIPNQSARDNRLSLKARGLHHYLLSLPEDWEVSIDSLSREMIEGKDAIRTAFNELFQLNYVVREEIRTQKGYKGWIYNVYPEPSTTLENPTLASPTSENPTTLKERDQQKKSLTKKDCFFNDKTPKTQKCGLGDEVAAEIPQDLWEGDRNLETSNKPKTQNQTVSTGKNKFSEGNKSSGACSTNEKTERDKLESLFRKGYRNWNTEELAFLEEQLNPFREIWNEYKFATFYPATKFSRRYLYFLLDFLVREGFEDCLKTFEKAVKALSVDPFWTGQSKQKPNDCLDIGFLLENPETPEFRDRIRIFSGRYRETANGRQIMDIDVKKAVEQKEVLERAEWLRQMFQNQGE